MKTTDKCYSFMDFFSTKKKTHIAWMFRWSGLLTRNSLKWENEGNITTFEYMGVLQGHGLREENFWENYVMNK